MYFSKVKFLHKYSVLDKKTGNQLIFGYFIMKCIGLQFFLHCTQRSPGVKALNDTDKCVKSATFWRLGYYLRNHERHALYY